ncbi:hypothetical protein DO97_21560 [Neosynechococcus sphagnicola sy1]|uniref:Uncharacterized protein n=1 Tax=Neosynechococcus sphagnicola sy1 TaxID=1497020 RepID=A0A098TH13_9CYAN|nr:hypothetical protein DO97_21560 [Neosynechococcus sphagnicola sy1]
MKITRNLAIQTACDIGLPPFVQALVQGEPLPADLRSYFGVPEEFFQLSEAEQEVYGQGLLVPLWDDSNFDSIAAYHVPSQQFVRFSPEAPIGATAIIPVNWQQLLLDDFIRLHEAGRSPERLHELAGLFGFNHVDDVLRGYSSGTQRTPQEYCAWHDALLIRLGNGA